MLVKQLLINPFLDGLVLVNALSVIYFLQLLLQFEQHYQAKKTNIFIYLL